MVNAGSRLRRWPAAGVAAAWLATALLAGCSTGAEREPDSARGARGAPPENHATATSPAGQHPSPASVADSACPRTGRWAECSLRKRLELSGLAVERGADSATEPPLARKGIAFTVRNAELEAYFYDDRAARERDQARLDASHYLRPEDSAEGSSLPTLIASENLLVVMASRRDRQRERISLAVTAGPPQP